MDKKREFGIHVLTIICVVVMFSAIIPKLMTDLDKCIKDDSIITNISIQKNSYSTFSKFSQKKRTVETILLYLHNGLVLALNPPNNKSNIFRDKQSIGKRITYYYTSKNITMHGIDPVQLKMDNKIIYDQKTLTFIDYSLILMTVSLMYFSGKKLIAKIKLISKLNYLNWDLNSRYRKI